MEQPLDSKESMGLIARRRAEMETDGKSEGGRRRDRDKWTVRQTGRQANKGIRERKQQSHQKWKRGLGTLLD